MTVPAVPQPRLFALPVTRVRALTRRTGAVVLAMNALILIYSHHAAVRGLESTMAQMLEPLEAFRRTGCNPRAAPADGKDMEIPSKKPPFRVTFFDSAYFDAMYFSCHRTLTRSAFFVPLRISASSSNASVMVILPSPFISP